MRGIAATLLVLLAGTAHADSPYDHRYEWPVPASGQASKHPRGVPSCDCTQPRPVAKPDGGARKHVALGLAIAGIALSGASVSLGLYERGRYTGTDNPHIKNDAVDTLRYEGTALAVTGIAALGVATYLYLTTPSEQLAIVPAVGPSGVGVSAAGSF